jgi:glycine cleavage system regulatory protein
MSKVEMLHTQSINIASMTKQFQTNNETKNALLVAQINITQQKHKAKIVNIKQAREIWEFKEEFKTKVKLILDLWHLVPKISKVLHVYKIANLKIKIRSS